MQFTYVISTNINAIAINGNNLIIKFNNGAIYEFENAAKEFTNLINSSSKGKYFYQYIRNKYPYNKIG